MNRNSLCSVPSVASCSAWATKYLRHRQACCPSYIPTYLHMIMLGCYSDLVELYVVDEVFGYLGWFFCVGQVFLDYYSAGGYFFAAGSQG